MDYCSTTKGIGQDKVTQGGAIAKWQGWSRCRVMGKCWPETARPKRA